MSVSEPFIRKPVATSLLTLGLVLIGLVSYFQLGVAALPATDFPIIVIFGALPGASPETMASSVATPIERNLGTLAGVSEISSINSTGSTTIIVQFDISRDIEKAAIDVQSAINASASFLPKDMPKLPFYHKANPNAFPIINLALTSDTLPAGTVYDYANSIVAQKLSQLDGVAQVNISGAEASAVRVQVNPGALAAMGLSLQAVSAAIQTSTAHGPKGSLDDTDKSWTITADDQLTDAEGYRKVIVGWKNGASIRLDDVATVFDSVANKRTQGLLNQSPAVNISVIKQADANLIATVNRVKAVLPLLSRWLPPNIKIAVTQDQTPSIQQGIRDVQLTLLLTVGLVVGVIALFLRRLWATVIPSITIPVSLIATCIVMYVSGFTLNNMSLMALLVAIGFVVDDAIVMIENIVRIIETGVSPVEAALRGARQMGFTIISITASLLSALIPMVFIGGVAGKLFGEFGITLCAAILVSAILSLTLTPALCGWLLPAEDGTKTARSGFNRRIAGAIDRIAAFYGQALEQVLNYSREILLLTGLVVIASVYLFSILPLGFFPAQDLGVIRAQSVAPPDISFQALSERELAVVDAILTDPAVLNVTSNIGGGSGMPGPPGGGAANTGTITINLKPFSERNLSTEKVMDRIRPTLQKIQGIDVYMNASSTFGGARAARSRYQYTLVGAVELPALQKWASALAARMQTMPEFTDVGTDQDSAGGQVYLKIDRITAARMGVKLSDIDQTLYDSFGQRQIAHWYGATDRFQVVMEADASIAQSPDSLSHIFVPGSSGQVPLSALATVQQGFTPVSLNHQGSQLAITVTYNTAQGISIGQAIAAIGAASKQIGIPADITAGNAGEALNVQQNGAAMPILLLTALVSIYLVLGMLYESLAHPLTILSTIPSAAFGALLALKITGTELSIVSMIGLILLIGIVMKNAILMVDFALEAQRQRGLSPREAILLAAKLRLRPILMTTVASVLGAVPIAIGMGVGSELRQPLGITMIGGLLSSQAMTLFSTPVVYLAIDRLAWRRRRISTAKPAG